MKKIGIIIFYFLVYLNTFGQIDILDRIEITGFIDNQNVMLRWAPASYSSWVRGNSYGYTVYRIPIIKDGNIISNPDTVILGKYLPQPLLKWERYADSSTFAVAAEAIYGKEFEVTTSTKSFIDIVNKSREQESRFAIGMLCADQSFTVACMMGLGLVDSTADPSIAYAYRVVANYTDSTNVHEEGYVFVDFKAGNFTPRPFGISHYVSKGQVTITFPYEPFKGLYTNFELERSSDRINFKTVVGKNYYSVSTTDDQQYYIYNDSVKQEVATYYYRLRGRTPFDTYGPYSDTMEVKIMPTIDGAPWITDIKEIDDKLSIAWSIDSIGIENLKGFMVYSSADQNGPFNPLLKDSIDRTSRYAYLQRPQDYSYYKVAAIDQFDRPYFSSARLFQAKDSIPPLPPVGLKGEFDSTGTVKLWWSYGKEPDLLGYQLLYSSSKDSEYSLLSKDFIFDSTYTAKFPLDMLCSDLYFKAVALDTRYNTSKASEPIVLVKPDTIPPSPPVLMVETDSLGNTIAKVSPSSSNDIAKHIIYFEKNDNTLPNEIFSGILTSDTSIVLKELNKAGKLYCTAFDKSGRTGISNKIQLQPKDFKVAFSIKLKENLLIDEGKIEFTWDASGLRDNILIYRKIEDENKNSNYRLIATVECSKRKFIDSNVFINNKYFYKFVYTLKNKDLSSTVTFVNYK
ncbi:MAG TPA: hypothetical protein DDY04_02920 [Bacteroidales bacterium]|nr:hypothetical protein [Bacteroidales bacterium]